MCINLVMDDAKSNNNIPWIQNIVFNEGTQLFDQGSLFRNRSRTLSCCPFSFLRSLWVFTWSIALHNPLVFRFDWLPLLVMKVNIVSIHSLRPYWTSGVSRSWMNEEPVFEFDNLVAPSIDQVPRKSHWSTIIDASSGFGSLAFIVYFKSANDLLNPKSILHLRVL